MSEIHKTDSVEPEGEVARETVYGVWAGGAIDSDSPRSSFPEGELERAQMVVECERDDAGLLVERVIKIQTKSRMDTAIALQRLADYIRGEEEQKIGGKE